MTTITIPAEHAGAVRDDLLETLGLAAERLEAQAEDIREMVEWLRRGAETSTAGELRLEVSGPRNRRLLRDWAKDAREDADETLRDIDTYYERDEWKRRSESLLAVSAQVLERVED